MKTFKEFYTEATRDKWPEIVWTTETYKSGLVEDYVFKNIAPEQNRDSYRLKYIRSNGGKFEEAHNGTRFSFMELKREARKRKNITVRIFDTEDEFMGELTLAEL